MRVRTACLSVVRRAGILESFPQAFRCFTGGLHEGVDFPKFVCSLNGVPEAEQEGDQDHRDCKPPGEQDDNDGGKERDAEHQVAMAADSECIFPADPEEALHGLAERPSKPGLFFLLLFLDR